jgi:hypothetical protein
MNRLNEFTEKTVALPTIFGNRIAGNPLSGQTVKEPVAKVVKPSFIVKIFRLPTERADVDCGPI